MAAGIVHDLAVGVHPEGADAWALQYVLATGVSVGAPPDMYNQMGQDWSQPPWRPDALAEAGFAPYRDMLRTVLRHAGGLRIDHVLGLFRLWWVPRGMPAYCGTYVALRPRRAGRHPRAGGPAGGRLRGRRGPRHRRAVGAGRAAGPGDPRHQHRVVRAVGVRADPPTGALARTVSWPASRCTTCRPPPGYLEGEHVRIRDELGLLARPVDEERAAAAQESARVGGSDGGVRAPGPRGRRRGGARRGAAPARGTVAGPAGRRCRCPTWWATAGRRTSRAPTRSTRTGGYPLCDGAGDRCCWTTCPPRPCSSTLSRRPTESGP